jgi:hypothetical protein
VIKQIDAKLDTLTDVDVIGVCPMWASVFEVESDKDSAVHYTVAFHKFEPAMCTCPAWKYSGPYGKQGCKHIQKLLKYGCFAVPFPPHNRFDPWDEAEFEAQGLRLISTTDLVTQEECPGCTRPLTTVWIS